MRDHGGFPLAPCCLNTENSRGKVQNVRGDSSAEHRGETLKEVSDLRESASSRSSIMDNCWLASADRIDTERHLPSAGAAPEARRYVGTIVALYSAAAAPLPPLHRRPTERIPCCRTAAEGRRRSISLATKPLARHRVPLLVDAHAAWIQTVIAGDIGENGRFPAGRRAATGLLCGSADGRPSDRRPQEVLGTPGREVWRKETCS